MAAPTRFVLRLASLVPPQVAPVMAVVALISLSTATLGPVFPLYLSDLGVSPASIGLIASTFAIALALGEASWGWLGQRLGLRRSLLFTGALTSAAVLGLAFTQELAAIYLLSAVRGVAFSAMFPASRSHVALAAAPERRAAALATLGVALTGTQSLGALLGGFVADAWGFRAVFVASASLAALATLVALVVFRPDRKGVVISPARAVAGGQTETVAFSVRPLVLQGLIAATFFMALGTSFTFLPVLAGPVQGLRASQVGLLFTVSGLVGMTLTIPLGHLGDRIGRERAMALGLLASAGAMTTLAFAVGFWQLLAGSSLARLSYALFSPAATARLSEIVPRERLTTAMGIYGFSEDIGVILGPAVGGAVWGPWGHRWTFLLGAVAGGLGLAALPLLARRRRGPA